MYNEVSIISTFFPSQIISAIPEIPADLKIIFLAFKAFFQIEVPEAYLKSAVTRYRLKTKNKINAINALFKGQSVDIVE